MDLDSIRRVGLAATHKGADALRSRFGRRLRIQHKGPADLVTDADLASERAIIETIRTAFPDHEILAEEGGPTRGNPDYQWIVDPLDGTTNFAHGLPLFAVSIAFWSGGRPLLGIVLNPMGGELYTASAGRGATLNGRPIAVSKTDRVADSLMVTGFPYDHRERMDSLLPRFTALLGSARGIRRLGSAALDLCWLACGRFDGFWEQNLQPWDVAAGMLIAWEAGALVTDFANRPYNLQADEILATNGCIHPEMLTLLNPKRNPE